MKLAFLFLAAAFLFVSAQAAAYSDGTHSLLSRNAFNASAMHKHSVIAISGINASAVPVIHGAPRLAGTTGHRLFLNRKVLLLRPDIYRNIARAHMKIHLFE